MDLKPILFVVGARPNFIKIAPLCQAIKAYPDLSFKIVHTGQHYDDAMSAVFFEELNIPRPDYHLNTGSASHGKQTGKMMIKLEELCLKHFFAAIVVIGDVNSTLAGALVGAKLNIPVLHIESGLRSFNRSMPEEINRIATDHISDLLFAPTQTAMINLAKEGLGDRAHFSGDVMYDTMLSGLRVAESRSKILQRLKLEPNDYFLATLHRPYNVDDPARLQEIMLGFQQLEKRVILSAHPRLQKNLKNFAITLGENIQLSEPLGYFDFILLEKYADKIITDSGGIQKEAFFVQTPCITLRPETEWMETIDVGANVLVVDRTAAGILDAANSDFSPRFHEQPYGAGNASEIILNTIQKHFEATLNATTI